MYLDTESAFQHSIRLSQTSARIVMAPSGGAFRTIVGHGSIRATSVFPSVKAGYSMPCEAQHERMHVRICEADPRIVDYQHQPHRLEIMLSNRSKPLVYFPDAIRQRDDGSIEVVETKQTQDQFERSSRYVDKLDYAEQVYATLGWRFLRLSQDKDLEVQPLWPNARMISRRNKRRATTADRLRFQEAADREGGTLPFGKAAEVLAADGSYEPCDAVTLLHRLIVGRTAFIDLTRRIEIDSPVKLITDPGPPSMLRSLPELFGSDIGFDELEMELS
ncbi:Tn7 transposase TnsA N-terminal domain-containing protein [Devosia albogilva]|uniref:Tn7 transposase TnsA N-terminal domain-containing protein n=1 Tax=Devosia albogilva TaxID=429726 RepID=A0ABW5QN49_9HYPH